MYLSDRIVLEQVRATGALDEFGHRGERRTRIEVWARIWGSMGGHRESIETITRPTSTVHIEGFSVVIPPSTDVEEGDLVVSIRVRGREYLSGGGSGVSETGIPGSRLVVRGIQEHRSNKELFCEVVR